MKSRYQFSVIIPTYNSGELELQRAIQSVLKQSYPSLEIIVVDDGSREPFAGLDTKLKDQRIRWISLCENGGVAKARNQGIIEASGDIIAFLDADDWWAADKLECEAEVYANGPSDLVMVYSSVYNHQPDGKVFALLAKNRGYLSRELLWHNPILGGGSAFSVFTQVLKEVGGFYEQDDIPEDRDLWLRVARKGWVEYVQKPVVHMQVLTSGSRSSQGDIKKQTYYRFIQLHEQALKDEGLYRHALSFYYYRTGDIYFNFQQPLKGWGQWIKTLRIMNFKGLKFSKLPIGAFSLVYPAFYRKAIDRLKSLSSKSIF